MTGRLCLTAFMELAPHAEASVAGPAPQAAAPSFRAAAIPTLETGREGLIDFHFTEAGTTLFALENNIYAPRREPTAGQKG